MANGWEWCKLGGEVNLVGDKINKIANVANVSLNLATFNFH